MTGEWKRQNLGNVIQLEYGKPLPDHHRRPNGLYPAYGANGEKTRTDNFYCSNRSIVVGRKGSAGELTLTEEHFWPLDVTYFVRFNELEYDLRFLYFLLRTLNLPSLAKGVKPGLNRNEVYQIPVAIPPLSEQQRIVGILDKAFESIDIARINAEKNIANARELFQSELRIIFDHKPEGWVVERLGTITSKIGSGATPRGGGKAYKMSGMPLIRSLNVHDGGFRNKKLAFIDTTQAKRLANVAVQPGDVLLNITGASVARCCVVPSDVLPARVNQHVSIIRPRSDTVDTKFLHFLLISEPYKKQLLGIGAEGGATRQAITKEQIKTFCVSFPADIGEQRAIVNRLSDIQIGLECLQAVIEQKVGALDSLKQSLLRAAFEGQL